MSSPDLDEKSATSTVEGDIDATTLDELDFEIAKLTAKLTNSELESKWPMVSVGLVIVLLGSAGLVFGAPYSSAYWTVWICVLLIVFGIFAIAGTFVAQQSNLSYLRTKLEVLEARRRIRKRFQEGTSSTSERDNKPDYFDSLVKINVDNLAQYYALVS